MSEESEGLGYKLFDRRLDDVQRLARLEEHGKQLATKEDLADLRGEIKRSNVELRGYVKQTVSDLEISTLKGFLRTLGFWPGHCGSFCHRTDSRSHKPLWRLTKIPTNLSLLH